MAAIRSDTWNILRKTTPSRAWNAAKLFVSYHLSRYTGKPFLWGLPMSMSIEPTTACNLGCPECPSGLRQFSRDTGNLKQPFFEKVINESKGHLSYLTFYFQGEPYINPKFLDMVKYASERNIYTATSTNAHFLNDEMAKKTIESGLDRLIISIDGVTQEVYESYRVHGKLNKVLEGTRNILKWRKKLNASKPLVVFQFLVVRPNEHQIDDVLKLGEELGVDQVVFKTAQVYDYENGNSLIPSNEKYSRYRKGKNGKYRIKNQLLNQCWRMWQGCVVTWDGLVVPCCFDKDAKHRMGDLKNTPMKEVWRGPVYRNFRQKLLRSRSEIDICTNCTEGTKVWSEA
ncbi:MAG: radical SAM protein [Cryomorphaceae bacterium]|nr:MAG: radical SAM protein [Cryomorphaceae bacterium]